MKQRFRLYRRAGKGVYYLKDTETGKRESLHMTDKGQAEQLLQAHRQAHALSVANLQLARIYANASDPELAKRTWDHLFKEVIKLKAGETKARYERAVKDHVFDSIRHKPLLQTGAQHFLDVLNAGGTGTNAYLRKFHSFALDMNWLLAPVLVKRKWPKVTYKAKRAITWDEHQNILAREVNAERKAFMN